MEFEKCEFECRKYRKDSLTCLYYPNVCTTYALIKFDANQLEIIKNQMQEYLTKEEKDGGLTVSDSIALIKLERQADELYMKFRFHGVVL